MNILQDDRPGELRVTFVLSACKQRINLATIFPPSFSFSSPVPDNSHLAPRASHLALCSCCCHSCAVLSDTTFAWSQTTRTFSHESISIMSHELDVPKVAQPIWLNCVERLSSLSFNWGTMACWSEVTQFSLLTTSSSTVEFVLQWHCLQKHFDVISGQRSPANCEMVPASVRTPVLPQPNDDARHTI